MHSAHFARILLVIIAACVSSHAAEYILPEDQLLFWSGILACSLIFLAPVYRAMKEEA
jgi:hypothetical protein